MATVKHRRLYIDGEWVDSETNETIETVDPATEGLIAAVSAAGPEDVKKAVDAAAAVCSRDSEWRSLAPHERGKRLYEMADILADWKDEIVSIESRDNGKTPFEAKIDIELTIDTFRYFAGWADKLHGDEIPVPGERVDYTVREPVGVTAHVVPWNYPFYLAGRSLAPALACGNTAVVKPAPETPLSALYFAAAAEEAGIPDGVVNILPGTGQNAGEALVANPDVDHIAFTGSESVGSHVMKQAADSITDVTLELGGKGPNIIFPDADLESAARGIHNGIFMNAGQMCWAGSRLVVHGDIHDEVVEIIVSGAEDTPLGSGIDDDARMGPLISESHRREVLDYIETGKAEGATLETGGRAPPDKESGFFVEPTVFTDVTNDMTIAREEIFGPVLSVIPFSDEAEALRIANNSRYGLMSGVWTSDISRGHQFARKLEYGMVSINEFPNTFPQTPFGGYKRSGKGREQGSKALDEYTKVKNINVNIK